MEAITAVLHWLQTLAGPQLLIEMRPDGIAIRTPNNALVIVDHVSVPLPNAKACSGQPMNWLRTPIGSLPFPGVDQDCIPARNRAGKDLSVEL